MFKKLFISILAFILSLSVTTTYALEPEQTIKVEHLEDGSYFETVIEVYSLYANNIRAASKTSTYKNSSGEALWSVTVKGTFTYTGSTSFATASSVTTAIYNDSWKITDSSASKSGNTASATATAKEYLFNTIILDTITRTVTLTCDKDGNMS